MCWMTGSSSTSHSWPSKRAGPWKDASPHLKHNGCQNAKVVDTSDGYAQIEAPMFVIAKFPESAGRRLSSPKLGSWKRLRALTL